MFTVGSFVEAIQPSVLKIVYSASNIVNYTSLYSTLLSCIKCNKIFNIIYNYLNNSANYLVFHNNNYFETHLWLADLLQII